MSGPISKLQRWLDLIAYLAGRRYPVSLEELRDSVPAYGLSEDASDKDKESVRRKFERDKDELRRFGIPIETVDFSVNHGDEHQQGYRLARRDFRLPYLRLLAAAGGQGAAPTSPSPPGAAFVIREDEAAAALAGLREIAALPANPLAREARSAFRKLAFDLDPEAVEDPPVHFVQDPEAARTQAALTQVSGAVMGRKNATFVYHGMQQDTRARRSVRPYGLLFQHGRWYLVGHDEDRGGVRMFRVGRMDELAVNPARPGTQDFEVPRDFRLEDYGGRRAWELGEDENGACTADVVFRFPRSLWAERNGYGTLVVERADGAQVRRFQVRRQDPFLRWVLSLAPDARVEAPDPLREAFAAMVEGVLRNHAGDEG